MHVNQSTSHSAERLHSIDRMLRQTAQLVSLIVGQLEVNQRHPTAPVREALGQLDDTVEKLNLLRVTLDSALSAQATAHHTGPLPASLGSVVHVVDDDAVLRGHLCSALACEGYGVREYASGEGFLERYSGEQPGCLIIDAGPPGIGGIELARRLRARGDELPIIMISGNSRVAEVVAAMKAGVCDVIEKPFRYRQLLTSVAAALAGQTETEDGKALRKAAIDHINHLTARQRQILAMVLDGHPSKNIAVDLGISQRTVEKHRASIMSRTEARSIPELARIALAAGDVRPNHSSAG
jgi:two-component system CheB/CheR fusion protein